MAIVALEGMRFFAHHGVYVEEQEKGNQFEVDVWVDTGDIPLPEDDNIENALDYSVVYNIVKEVMEVRVDLLETLVLRIGRKIREEWKDVGQVRVRVSKGSPPVPGDCRRSYVEEVFHA